MIYGLFACIIASPGFVPAVFCGRGLDTLDAGSISWQMYLSKFREVDLEGFGVLVKPKTDHGVKDVFAAYGFALLDETFLCSFTRNETYEL
jgi:hypothetical protein